LDEPFALLTSSRAPMLARRAGARYLFLMDYGFVGSFCSGVKRYPVDLYAIEYRRFELNHHINLAMRSSEREAGLDEGPALFLTENGRILPSRWYSERLYQRRSWIPE
jgi:hypothetical protein